MYTHVSLLPVVRARELVALVPCRVEAPTHLDALLLITFYTRTHLSQWSSHIAYEISYSIHE